MTIDQQRAAQILREEVAQIGQAGISPEWAGWFRELSEICHSRNRTHIAFLGTALLAKAVDLRADVFSVKGRSGGPGAYSARNLAHGVLVPLAAELGIGLGVTGREPLNNQPYFRMNRVDDGTAIHSTAKEGFAALTGILERLAKVENEDEARLALRTFIAVRREFQPEYPALAAATALSISALIAAIDRLVASGSEGGKRAQAVVAALLDLVVGPERVATTRINDPDRRVPGDVGVRRADDLARWGWLIEVRDKPVSVSDVYAFARKALEAGTSSAAIAAVAPVPREMDYGGPVSWAEERGLHLRVIVGWAPLVSETLFWCALPLDAATATLTRGIPERLIELEASPASVELWNSLTTRDEGTR